MDANSAAAWVVIISAIFAGLGSLIKLWRRDDHTDARLDSLWEAQMRRGMIEALEKKLVVQHPKEADPGDTVELAIRPDVRRAYEPIAPVLREILKETKSEGQFAEVVNIRLGDWIVKHICEPLGLRDMSCYKMAYMTACESDRAVKVDSDVQKDKPVSKT